MKNKFILMLIIAQLAMIFYLLYFFDKRRDTLGISVNIKSRDTRTTNGNSEKKSNLKYFYEMEPNYVDHEVMPWLGGGVVDLKLNSEGLNDVEYARSPNDYCIVAIGDSFTYGQFVERNKNWVSLLEKELNKKYTSRNVKVVNLGVMGYDIEYAVEKYRLKGQKYKPDLLIWLLKEDDFISIAELLTLPTQNAIEKLRREKNITEEELIVPEEGKIAPQYALDAMKEMYSKVGGERGLLKYQNEKLRSIRNYYKGNILIPYFASSKEIYDKLLYEFAKEDKKILLVKLPDIYENDIAHYPDGHPNILGHQIIFDSINRQIEGLILK